MALAVVLAARWGSRGAWFIEVSSPEECREGGILGLATVGVVLLHLLQYDRDLFAFTCTHRAVSIASRTDVGALWTAVEVPRVLIFDEENDSSGRRGTCTCWSRGRRRTCSATLSATSRS